jgi:hypothetical protein
LLHADEENEAQKPEISEDSRNHLHRKYLPEMQTASDRILPNEPTRAQSRDMRKCGCGYTRWCDYSDIAKFQHRLKLPANGSLAR